MSSVSRDTSKCSLWLGRGGPDLPSLGVRDRVRPLLEQGLKKFSLVGSAKAEGELPVQGLGKGVPTLQEIVVRELGNWCGLGTLVESLGTGSSGQPR